MALSLFTALVVGAAFLLGLRVGLALGKRTERRRLGARKALPRPSATVD